MSGEPSTPRSIPRRIPPRVRVIEWAYRLSPTTPPAVRLALSAEGQVNPSECRLLYELAAAVPRDGGAIVEIGSYRGRSTIALALGARDGARPVVHAVDPHAPHIGVMGGVYGPTDGGAMAANLRRCGVARDVRCLATSSLEAAASWHGPIGLLWIDGDHRLDAVAADVAAWTPFLRPDGVLALHDARRPGLGPTRVVERLLASGAWRLVVGTRTGRRTGGRKGADVSVEMGGWSSGGGTGGRTSVGGVGVDGRSRAGVDVGTGRTGVSVGLEAGVGVGSGVDVDVGSGVGDIVVLRRAPQDAEDVSSIPGGR